MTADWLQVSQLDSGKSISSTYHCWSQVEGKETTTAMVTTTAATVSTTATAIETTTWV